MNPFVAHPKLQMIKELQSSKMFGFDFLITCLYYIILLPGKIVTISIISSIEIRRFAIYIALVWSLILCIRHVRGACKILR